MSERLLVPTVTLTTKFMVAKRTNRSLPTAALRETTPNQVQQKDLYRQAAVEQIPVLQHRTIDSCLGMTARLLRMTRAMAATEVAVAATTLGALLALRFQHDRRFCERAHRERSVGKARDKSRSNVMVADC